MAHTKKQAARRDATSDPPNQKINGEDVLRQLEELLDQYKHLDEPTLEALKRAFNRYNKDLRRSLLKAAASRIINPADEKKQVDTAGDPAGKTAAPPATAADNVEKQADTAGNPADKRADMVKLLEDRANELRKKCLAAEKAYVAAKAQYEYQKTVFSVYEETVLPFIEPFKKAMANLVYFAACADPAVYEEGKIPLQNKSRALRNGMQPGMWGEYLDAAHLDRIDEMFTLEKAAATFRFQEEVGGPKTCIRAYQRRIEAANEARKPYDAENAKLSNGIRHAQLLWEYVDLLRCFLPQLETIAGTPEEEESAQWATQIGAALLAEVENHSCRNTQMKFLWVYPRGEISAGSEKVRVDFIAAELDCPGLYYSSTDNQDGRKRLVCVIPGCTKE